MSVDDFLGIKKKQGSNPLGDFFNGVFGFLGQHDTLKDQHGNAIDENRASPAGQNALAGGGSDFGRYKPGPLSDNPFYKPFLGTAVPTTPVDNPQPWVMRPGESPNRGGGNDPSTEGVDNAGAAANDAANKQRFIDDLLKQINAPYQGSDAYNIQKQALADALAGHNAQVGKARQGMQDNFNMSDANLAAMFNAYQHDAQTTGADRYSQIGDQAVNSIHQNTQQGQQDLQNINSQQQAQRAAMLKDLGIEQAAPANTGDALNQGIASIGIRGDSAAQHATEDKATNLAYNQGVATSIGAQGAEKRAQLGQQLQALLGKLDLADSQFQGQNQMQLAGLNASKSDADYQQFLAKQKYAQDQLTGIQNRDQQLQDDQTKFERDMALKQAGATPQKTPGLAGVAQDLLNSGYDAGTAQAGMAALSDSLSQNILNTQQGGYAPDKASVLMNDLVNNKHIDKSLALQLVTSYLNLGSVSGFASQPY